METTPIQTHIEYQYVHRDIFPYYLLSECVETKPHYIFHFDVNRTLIFSDVVQKQSPEDVIVNGLADRLEYRWDDTLTHPLNYTNYVKYHLFPNPDKSKEIKQKQKDQTTRFLQFLEETKHPLFPEAQRLFDRAKKALENKKTLVFTSFYKFLEYLQKNNITYTLVFRTFGSDIGDVAAEFNELLGNQFLTDFQKFNQGKFCSNGIDQDFYTYVKEANHHIAIQDDWNWWFKHGENYQYGKPFPIDFDDRSVCSLFFDDNATLNRDHPENNIVAPIDIRKAKEFSPEELVARKQLFPIDTLEALCNDNYFIELFQSTK